MRQRAAVVLTLGPALILFTYLGGWAYFFAISALLLLAADEYRFLISKFGLDAPRWLLPLLVFIQLILVVFAREGLPLMQMGYVLSAALTVGYAIFIYRDKNQGVFAHWACLMAGLFLIGWGGGHLLRLRFIDPAMGSEAWKWTILCFITIWSVDSFAYLSGSFLAGRFGLGRHAIFPYLSPKKTLEGYLGGAIGGILLGMLVGATFLSLPLGYCLALTFSVGFLSVGGDVLISMLKREAEEKDSGVIFPGHGGALDRIDTLVWSAMFAYYLLYIFNMI